MRFLSSSCWANHAHCSYLGARRLYVPYLLAGAVVTLNDIGRMLKLAHVPQSKVIHTTCPNPAFVVIVPKASYFIIANVVGQLKMRTDNVTVRMLDDERDVREGEHLYVKVTGDDGRIKRDMLTETRRMYQARRRARNSGVVIDCLSTVSL